MKEFQFRGMESPHNFDDNTTKKAKGPKNGKKKSKVGKKSHRKKIKKLQEDFVSLKKDFLKIKESISGSDFANNPNAPSKDKRPEDRIIRLIKREDKA